MAAHSPPSNNALAQRTLKFLGQQLRLHQFILRGRTKERKLAQHREDITRKQVKSLVWRIQREIDRNPGLFAKGAARDEDGE